jgi:hypothetical protein
LTGDDVRKLFDYAKENQVRSINFGGPGAFLTFIAVRDSRKSVLESVCFDLY